MKLNSVPVNFLVTSENQRFNKFNAWQTESDIKRTAQNMKRRINKIANTKGGTDGQT